MPLARVQSLPPTFKIKYKQLMIAATLLLLQILHPFPHALADGTDDDDEIKDDEGDADIEPDQNLGAKLKVTNITYGRWCNYEEYIYFLIHHINESHAPMDDKLLFQEKPLKADKFYGDMFEDFCFIVDTNKAIGLMRWDCKPDAGPEPKNGTCGCGDHFSHVDEAAPKVRSLAGRVRYFQMMEGVDKRLVYDHQEKKCASGPGGHCTLPTTTTRDPALKMKCVTGYSCVPLGNDPNSMNPFTNPVSNETYGFCVDSSPVSKSSRGLEESKSNTGRTLSSKLWSSCSSSGVIGVTLAWRIYTGMNL